MSNPIFDNNGGNGLNLPEEVKEVEEAIQHLHPAVEIKSYDPETGIALAGTRFDPPIPFDPSPGEVIGSTALASSLQREAIILTEKVAQKDAELSIVRSANQYLKETQVPNIIIPNASLRKSINLCLDLALVGVIAIMVADASSPAFNLEAYTIPVLAGLGVLRTAFGRVQDQNTPTEGES